MKSNLWLVLLMMLVMVSCTQQYNPPFFNPPWEGRPFPTNQNPIPGMGGFYHKSLYSELNDVKIGYSIVLPKDYYNKEYADSTFPVIYFLHGFTGTETADIWNSKYYYQETLKGNFPEVIMVFPNGMNEDYRDNCNGKLFIESHLIKELIPHINSEYRTNTKCVGLVGFSMGGRGAVKFLLRYPEIFNYAVSIDGTMKNQATDTLSTEELAKYGSVANYNTYTTEVLLEKCLNENPGLESKLAFMLLTGQKRMDLAKEATEMFNKFGIENVLVTDTFPHDATRFYDKYADQIIEFERNHLCRE